MFREGKTPFVAGTIGNTQIHCGRMQNLSMFKRAINTE
jgi:hypothetical protein